MVGGGGDEGTGNMLSCCSSYLTVLQNPLLLGGLGDGDHTTLERGREREVIHHDCLICTLYIQAQWWSIELQDMSSSNPEEDQGSLTLRRTRVLYT